MRAAGFKFSPFSKKQRMVLNWWTPGSPVKDYDGIIADGAIRSGKTVSMSFSFVAWAMENFDGQNLIMAGKTVLSFRRNVLSVLIPILRGRGYACEDRRGDGLIVIRRGDRVNNFCIFGGHDDRSQVLELHQGSRIGDRRRKCADL